MKKVHKKSEMTFSSLVSTIKNVNQQCFRQAAKAVNAALTIRNWTIGYYIEEYERVGVDRARYGERLMQSLGDVLTKQGLSRCDRRELYRYRHFYLTYPQIVETLTPQLPIQKKNLKIVETASPQFTIPGKRLVEQFCFSHFSELLKIEDSLKRAFYEHECIRGNWSVRELKRQIATLYFERSGLSKNKKKLAALITKKAEIDKPEFAVRDPYVFEFLGIKSKEVIGESHVEDALLDRLQGKNHTMVEYALAGMDNNLFVKKYQLELPKKKEIQMFLESHIDTKSRRTHVKNHDRR